MSTESGAELIEAARRLAFEPDPSIDQRIDAALWATTDRGEIGRLHIARALTTQGSNPAESADAACLALPHLLAAGLTASAAFASSIAAICLDQTGDRTRAMEYAVDAMILVADSATTELESVRASFGLGGYFMRLCAVELAVEHCRRAFQGAKELDSLTVDNIAFTFGYIAAEAGHLASDPQTRDRYLTDAHGAAVWLGCEGSSEVTRHLLADGVHAEIALASGREVDRDRIEVHAHMYVDTAPDLVAWHRLVRAMAARRAGEPIVAIELLNLAIPGLKASADNHCLVRALKERAEACAATGDLASAYADSKHLANIVRSWQLDQVGRLAEQLTRCAELERSTSDLRAVAEQLTADLDYDVTTGARSRRWLEAHLTDLGSCEEHGAMLMIDIDRFKDINDNFGHNIGDEVLATFGSLVATTTGARGDVARFGGEEFLVIAPGLDAEYGSGRAWELAEQIRLEVAAFDWEIIAAGITLTTSVGVASGPLSDARQLLIRSDDALLEAKRRGRNRTMVDRSAVPHATMPDADLTALGVPAGLATSG